MRNWRTSADLLQLFSVNLESEGARRFCDLCDLGSLLIGFSEPFTVGDLERAMLRELRLSPLLYWSCIKQAVRPLLSAGGDTLRALGVPVEGDPSTAHHLAVAVATALAEDLRPEDKQLANDVARAIGEGMKK